MALPKLETKTYTLTLPSTGEDIKYRPFLVKEQKILLMANDSKNDTEVADAMSQLISSCTFGKINPRTCPMFDAEYIFLKLRAKSVGEKAEIQVTCPDDKKTKVNIMINLEDIECNMTENHTNTIEITDTIKIVFNYPLISSFKDMKESNQTESMFNIIYDCIGEIHFDGQIYNKKDMSKDELTEFIDSMTTEQFQDISEFFNSMPKLRYPVEVTNPNTKVKSEIVLEGLQTFLV